MERALFNAFGLACALGWVWGMFKLGSQMGREKWVSPPWKLYLGAVVFATLSGIGAGQALGTHTEGVMEERETFVDYEPTPDAREEALWFTLITTAVPI